MLSIVAGEEPRTEVSRTWTPPSGREPGRCWWRRCGSRWTSTSPCTRGHGTRWGGPPAGLGLWLTPLCPPDSCGARPRPRPLTPCHCHFHQRGRCADRHDHPFESSAPMVWIDTEDQLDPAWPQRGYRSQARSGNRRARLHPEPTADSSPHTPPSNAFCTVLSFTPPQALKLLAPDEIGPLHSERPSEPSEPPRRRRADPRPPPRRHPKPH